MNSSISIAFYNVENLFDVYNNTIKFDEDFSPKAPKRWDKNRYELKLKKIAKVLSEIGVKETSQPPFFIGLSEIENDKVITDLINQESLKEFNYDFCHYNSRDERGIDVALIYRKDFFEVLETNSITVPLTDLQGDEDFTRDILYCKGIFQNEIVHIFTVHLPSKRQNNINLPSRIKILQRVRELTDDILTEEPSAYICLLGDFNENPNNTSFKQELKTQTIPDLVMENEYYNPFEVMLSESKFSLFHLNQGHLFDQILFSKRFIESGTLEYHYSKVYSPYYLQDFSSKHLGQPLRTYVGSRYIGGYSDHFPVFSVLKIN